jgi:hypothetical protein
VVLLCFLAIPLYYFLVGAPLYFLTPLLFPEMSDAAVVVTYRILGGGVAEVVGIWLA